jgi:hypothetical protein
MPLPAVRRAIQRAGIGQPTAPEGVHQLACWLGTTYAGTARQLVNLRILTAAQASALVRSWRAGSQRIRAALCGSATPPPGRVWMIRAEASGAALHVLPGDTLVFPSGDLPDPLPLGLAVHSDPQLSLDPGAAVTVTAALTDVTALTTRSAGGRAGIEVALIPRPERGGIDTVWRPNKKPADLDVEAI